METRRHKPPKPASQAVLSGMQLTLNAKSPHKPHGASRLVQETSAWPVIKTRRSSAPALYGCEDLSIIIPDTTTSMHGNEHTPPRGLAPPGRPPRRDTYGVRVHTFKGEWYRYLFLTAFAVRDGHTSAAMQVT